jgi:sugar phosphate isomerase/epimerase
MRRRDFLAAACAARPLLAANRIGRSRVSAITDEIARTPADAIAFAKQYQLSWLELRSAPGIRREYARIPEEEIRAAAREFAENDLKVSFLNTGMLKFALPGTEPLRRQPPTEAERAKQAAAAEAAFEQRFDYLRNSIRAAQILGVNKIRVFSFHRVADPAPLFPRIADIVGELVRVAEREGVTLLLENEGSCNAATCAESVQLMKMIPSRAFGLNWDPLNGAAFKETPFPDGYRLLPKKRIGNVQIKGRSILDYPQKLDWAAIFRALEKDGYQGQVGLETHIFGDQLIEHSHAAMREILRIVDPS